MGKRVPVCDGCAQWYAGPTCCVNVPPLIVTDSLLLITDIGYAKARMRVLAAFNAREDDGK